MALATWWRGDSMPTLPILPGFRVENRCPLVVQAFDDIALRNHAGDAVRFDDNQRADSMFMQQRHNIMDGQIAGHRGHRIALFTQYGCNRHRDVLPAHESLR